MFSNFNYEKNKERERAIIFLEKLKAFESSHRMYRYKLSNGMIISASTKEGLEEMKAVLESE